jgi:hypothetical protein
MLLLVRAGPPSSQKLKTKHACLHDPGCRLAGPVCERNYYDGDPQGEYHVNSIALTRSGSVRFRKE